MFFWAALEKGLPFFLNFTITIVLARLVPPEAYGLVAMTAMITAIGTVIQNIGLSSALIQREVLTEDDTTTTFLANIALSVSFGCILFLVAPLVASFFGQPELIPIVWANAFVLIIGGFGIIQATILQRQFRFRTGVVVELGAMSLAGAVAIMMAVAGHDVWALVAFVVGQQGARTILLWLLVRWVPRGRFSRSSFSVLWTYGRHLFLASLYHNFATNLTSVIIGKLYSAGILGLFARAQSLQMMPIGLVTMPFQRVAFPLYSRHQDDLPKLAVLIRIHARTLALIASFLMAVLMVCADEIVLVLFGQEWAASGAYLKILSAATIPAMLMPLHSEANKGIGKSSWFLRIEVIKKSVLIAAVVVGAAFGIQGLLIALVFASLSDYVLSAISSVRFVSYGWWDQVADALPSVATAVVSLALAQVIFEVVQPRGALYGLVCKGGMITAIYAAVIIAVGPRYFPEASASVHSLSKRILGKLNAI